MFTRKRFQPPLLNGDAGDARIVLKAVTDYFLSLEQKGALSISEAVVYASQGVAFPATQVPSSNANTLDDYKEITSWDPALGGTATYTNRYGRAIKIGKLVIAWGRIEVNAIGTGSTTTISGLPYTAAATTMALGGSCGYFSTLAATVSSLVPVVLSGTSTIQFTSTPGAGAATMTVPTVIFQNGTVVNFTAIYEAAD